MPVRTRAIAVGGMLAFVFAAGLVHAAARPVPQGALQPAPRTVADGVYTRAQAERGHKSYTVFCEGCHAADLSGNNSGDSGAPPLKRDGFMAGSDANGLLTKIRQTMPFDAPGSLPADDYLDILAYIFQENGFPPGTSPLTDDAEQLRAIRIIRKP